MALSRWVLKIFKNGGFYSFKELSSTSPVLCLLGFSSLPSSVSLCCTSSSLSVSLLFCGDQNFTQENNHLQSAARLCSEPSSLQWHTAASFHFVVDKDHKFFSVECLSTLLSLACPGAWGYSTPGARLHLSLLNLRFPLAHSSSLPQSLLAVVLLSNVSVIFLNLM